LANNERLGVLEGENGSVACHRWKVIEKIVECLSTLQVIE